MSDLPSETEARPVSPWLSIWWRPRDTIDDIVARPPSHLALLLLAAFGGAASAVNTLCGFGAGTDVIDWRILLGSLVLGGGFAIINLYVIGFVASWLGRLIGGHASAASVRAVFAGAMLPLILGLLLVLAAATVFRGMAVPGPDSLPRILQLVGSAFGIWGLIVTLLMLARVERFGFWKTIFVYVVAAWLLPGLAALGIRTFLYQPFSIPSASNVPTLLVGDNLFASKYAYGYSHFSLPFSPSLFPGRILAADPVRGDLVVFRANDGVTDFVKRIVGLPGDRIQMKGGQLYINDAPVQREQVDDFVGGDACGTEPDTRIKRWRETLPNGVSYETLDCVNNGFYDNTGVYVVPAGHLFMIGDNRDNSTDSRVATFGTIPIENLIGRAGMIFFSAAHGAKGGVKGEPAGIRSERMGMVVR